MPTGNSISICVCGHIVNLRIIGWIHMKLWKPIEMIYRISHFKLHRHKYLHVLHDYYKKGRLLLYTEFTDWSF